MAIITTENGSGAPPIMSTHRGGSSSSGNNKAMNRSKSFFHRAMSVRTRTLLRATSIGEDDEDDGGEDGNGGRRQSRWSTMSSSRWSSSIRSSTRTLQSSVGSSIGFSFRKSASSPRSKKNKEEGGGGGVKKLDRDDVEVGKLLGKGGFNHVYEVTNVRRPSLLGSMTSAATGGGGGGKVSADPASSSSLRRSSSACSTDGTNSNNFVVKHLSPSCFDDESKFRAAALDLAREAKLLSTIHHPSVIKLHGVTKGCIVSAFSSDDDAGYFLVLDKLVCTLDEKLYDEWRIEERRTVRRRRTSVDEMLNGPRSSNAKRRAALLSTRLESARQIAEGVTYLHGRRIVYRDIKPANVGFDASGHVKIFDFGLSRELPPELPPSEHQGHGDNRGAAEEDEDEDEDEEEGRRTTAMVGTPRYMAPEIARCEPYGLSADVYSYGLLLWEMCALEKPYRKFTARDLHDKVAYGTTRPKLSSKWSVTLRGLIAQCWHVDPEARPEFGDVVRVLKEETAAGGEITA